MHAELKSICFVDDVFDFDCAFHTLKPLCVPMHASIGTTDSPGEDLFVFKACNILWLKKKVSTQPLMINKTILCDGMTLHDIEIYMRTIVSKINGPDWNSIVAMIEVFADWEYSN